MASDRGCRDALHWRWLPLVVVVQFVIKPQCEYGYRNTDNWSLKAIIYMKHYYMTRTVKIAHFHCVKKVTQSNFSDLADQRVECL